MQFFAWTGSPFVDNGIGAMLAHCEKEEPCELTAEDVEHMGREMLRIYLQPAWLKAMQNIFPNGAFTNGAYANPPGKRRQVVQALTDFLVEQVKPLEVQGSCVFCGRRSPLRLDRNDQRKLPNNMVLSKTYIPLNGGVLNFFPAGLYGADVCAACVFAIQCSPLNFYTCNFDEKRFFVLHCNSFDFLRDWSDEARKDVNHQSASGHWTGPFNEGVNNAHNAFFHAVEKVMERHNFAGEHRTVSVRFYHFDNYNQPKSEPLKIYDMPAPVFHFLWEAKNSGLNAQWRQLVRRNFYFIKNGRQIPLPLSTTNEEKSKTTKNLILEKLLRGESIVANFYRRRRTFASWDLLALYLREVRSMADERTETVKRVADDIAEFIKSRDDRDRLTKLELAKNYVAFRNQLRFIARERFRSPQGDLIFTYDEYVDQLFPAGIRDWRETQDLILFRLYEKLHGWLRPDELPPLDEIDADSADNGIEEKPQND